MATSISVNNDNEQYLNTVTVKFKEIIATDLTDLDTTGPEFEDSCELISWAKDIVSPPSGLLNPLSVKKLQAGYQLMDGHSIYLALKQVHGNHVLDLDIPVIVDQDYHQPEPAAQLIINAEKAMELKSRGYSVPEISHELNISTLATNQRLAIAKLPADVKQLVMSGSLKIRAASALTLIPDTHLFYWREAFANDEAWAHSEDGIKAYFSLQILMKTDAIFPLNKYTGEYFDNWFDSEPITLFKDREQFWKLQFESLWELEAELLSKGWPSVLIITEGQKNLVPNFRTAHGVNPFTCHKSDMADRVAMINVYKCGYVTFTAGTPLSKGATL